MRRFTIGCSAAAVLLVGSLTVSTAVQATTPPTEEPTEGHPFVGTWIYAVDGFPEQFTTLVAIHADGIWHEANAYGESAIGSWEATGPDSFDLRFTRVYLTGDEESVGMFTIRAAGEVSEDGQSWTAEYTLELTGEGAAPGEYGAGSATGTRINVEPMGTPVGPVEPSSPTCSRPRAAPRRLAPNRWGPHRRGRSRQAPEPVGTEPAGTEPAGTEPAGTTPVDSAVATSTA